MAKAKAKTKTKAKAKTKTKAKPAKKTAAKKKKPAAKKKGPAKKAPKAAATGPEAEVTALLKDYEDGSIDNAWDVIGDMHELDGRLSKSSPLRPAFDKMFGEIEDICRESAGG